jgi:hypothetical protein
MSDDHWHRPLFQVRAGELTGDTGRNAILIADRIPTTTERVRIIPT